MADRVRKDKVQLDLEINAKKGAKSLKQLRSEYRSYKKQLDEIPRHTKDWDAMAKKVRETGGEIKAANMSLRTMNKTGGLGAKVFRSIGTAIKTAFLPLLALSGIIEIFQGVKEGVDTLSEARTEASKLSGETGEALDNIAARSVALERAIGTPFQKNLKAANVLVKSYGTSWDEAYDKIGTAQLLVAENQEEILDQAIEYGPLLAEAGVSMDRLLAISVRAANQGVFSDKGLDAVKEFNLRIKDLSTGQREVLQEALGAETAKALEDGLKNGQKTAEEVLAAVASRVSELGEDSAQAQRIVSNLFGGPGEDAGVRFISTLQDADESLNDLLATADIYVIRQAEQLELEEALAAEQAKLAASTQGVGSRFKKLTTQLKTGFFNVLVRIVNFISFFPEHMRIAGIALGNFTNEVIKFYEDALNGLASLIPGLNFLLEKIGGIKLPKIKTGDIREAMADLNSKMQAERDVYEEQNQREEIRRVKETEAKKNQQRSKATEAQLAKERKLRERAAKAIEKLELEVMDEGLDKELKRLELKYKADLKGFQGTEAEKARFKELLDEKKLQDEEKVREKFRAKQKADDDKAAKETEDSEKKSLKKRLENLRRNIAERNIELLKKVLFELEHGTLTPERQAELNDKKLQLEREFLDKKLLIQKEFGLDPTATQEEIIEAEIADQEAKNEAIIETERGKWEKITEITETAHNALNNLIQFTSALFTRSKDKELDALEEQKERELALAGDNAKARERIEEKFNEKREDIELKYRRKQKALQLAQGTIDVAAAVIKALGTPPVPNVAAAAIMAGLGALQLGTIAATKLAGGGVISGPSHSSGGVPYYSPYGNVELEGREIVLNKNIWTRPDWVRTVSDMNQATGGAKIMAGGGTIPGDEAVSSTGSDTNLALMAAIENLSDRLESIQFVHWLTEADIDALDQLRDNMNNRRTRGLGLAG